MTILHALTSYSGRMSRSEFWNKGGAPLFLAIIILFGVLAALFGPPFFFSRWSDAVSVGLIWFQLPLLVKRTHDRNHSALYLCIALIPVLGWLWLFVELGFLKGTAGQNRFGIDALQAKAEQTLKEPAHVSVHRTRSLILLVLSILLGLAATAVVALMPSFCNIWNDTLEGQSLPALTIFVANAALVLHRSAVGANIGGLLLGFWMWMGVRAYHSQTSPTSGVQGKRWLWVSIILGIVLNGIAGLAIYLPFPAILAQVNTQQEQHEANQPSEGTR